MSGQFTDFRPEQTKKPEPPSTRPDANSNDKRVQEAIAMSLVQAQRQTDKEKAYNFFKEAIDIADSTKNPLLQSATRTELGIACLNWGFKETGYKWIMEGASKNPDFYNDQKNQAFKARLTEAGVPAASLNLIMQNGQRDPLWFTKDKDAGKKVEAASTAPIVNPQLNPNPFNIPVDVRPVAPNPTPFRPTPFTPAIVPAKPDSPVPQMDTHLKPSPFKK
jgi:hypothetical protein